MMHSIRYVKRIYLYKIQSLPLPSDVMYSPLFVSVCCLLAGSHFLFPHTGSDPESLVHKLKTPIMFNATCLELKCLIFTFKT